MKFFKGLHWVAIAVVLLALAPSPEVARGQAIPKHQNPTPEQLTAIWWQWFLGLPATDHPFFDETGDDAANGQPYTDLFFLVGDASGTAERSITVSEGTAFFFPILNTEWDNVGITAHLGGAPQKALSVPELRAIAAANQDGAHDLVVTLTPTGGDPINVPYARLQSPPFKYVLPKGDNLYQAFGLDISGAVAPAVSDGYWSYIPPLAPGEYTLHFTGTSNGGINNGGTQDITYHITVE